MSLSFPKSELYGLSAKIRRSAVSIAANIAEGFRRQNKLDNVRFLKIAQASAEECNYYLNRIKDLEYSDITEANRMIKELSKLLDAYAQYILTTDGLCDFFPE
jgi:four helix bundle protein